MKKVEEYLHQQLSILNCNTWAASSCWGGWRTSPPWPTTSPSKTSANKSSSPPFSESRPESIKYLKQVLSQCLRLSDVWLSIQRYWRGNAHLFREIILAPRKEVRAGVQIDWWAMSTCSIGYHLRWRGKVGRVDHSETPQNGSKVGLGEHLVMARNTKTISHVAGITLDSCRRFVFTWLGWKLEVTTIRFGLMSMLPPLNSAIKG